MGDDDTYGVGGGVGVAGAEVASLEGDVGGCADGDLAAVLPRHD